MINFIKNGASIFKKKQEDILSAAFIIAFSVALSGILGLFRYRLLASHFGYDIKLLDSFFAASALPDAIFEVLIFGAIALAFIPVFSQYLSRDKLQKAWDLSSTMITLGLVIFVVFTIIIFALANFIAPIIAPGVVAKNASTGPIIANLLRIMTLAQLFFVVSIFLTGILQSFQRFFAPAIASVAYNLGIIFGIIFLTPFFGIYAPAIGMIIGAILHLIIQLPLALSMGFRYRPNFNFKNKDVAETFALMWPRSIALGLIRLNDIVNIAVASIAVVGSIVAFNFALALQLVPVSLFAASIAQAALPSLSIEFGSQRYDQFKKLFYQSFHQINFLIFPAAAIVAILRIPLVRLVFGAKELPWDITVLTGRVLVAFSVGIAAQALSLLITRSFYAIKDSATPVKISTITTAANILASIVMVVILKFSIVYLALNFSIANIANVLLLFYFLDRKVSFNKKELAIPFFKMLGISFVMAITLYVPLKILDQLVIDTTRTFGLLILTGITLLAGFIVYTGLSWLFGIGEVSIFYNLGKRVIFFPSKLTKPSPTSIDAQHTTP